MAWPPQVRTTLTKAALAAALLVGLIACDTTPMNTFDPQSDAADRILTIYILVTVVASIVGVLVLGGLLFILFKFRARPGRAASQTHGNAKLEVAWTIAPVFVLLLVGIPGFVWIAGTTDDPPADIEVQAIGHQWWFEFRYPGLGPDGTDLVTANELRLPVGKNVSITLHSDDVIHSFWVPKLVGKTDMVPNRTNQLEMFNPNQIGEFHAQCAEFCGSAHALMRFRVMVDSLADFNSWVETMNTPPAEPEAGSSAARGQVLFITCSACHTVAGTTAQGTTGPNLTLFGERTTVGAGIMENTDDNLRSWIGNVRSFKPIPEGAQFMPTFEESLSDAQIADLAAYLKSLAR